MLRHRAATSAASGPLFFLLHHRTTAAAATIVTKPSGNCSPSNPKRTSAYYDEQTDEALKKGDIKAVGNLLRRRFRDGLLTTVNTFRFSATLDGLSSLQQLTEYLAVLDCGTHGKKSAFDCLIACLCKHRLPAEARSVVQTMIDRQCGANTVSFHPLVSFLSRTKAIDKVEETFRWMRTSGIEPDIVCYNYVLMSHCISGRWQEAVEVLRKMEEEKFVLDSRTYDALVLAACRIGRLDGALRILKRMADDGINILYCTYLHIVRAFLEKGLFQEGLEFVVAVSGRDASGDVENFGFLARWCARKKWVEKERLVLKLMKQRGLHSNLIVSEGFD